MPDKFVVDHVANTITFHVETIALTDMTSDDVVKWLKEFIVRRDAAAFKLEHCESLPVQ